MTPSQRASQPAAHLGGHKWGTRWTGGVFLWGGRRGAALPVHPTRSTLPVRHPTRSLPSSPSTDSLSRHSSRSSPLTDPRLSYPLPPPTHTPAPTPTPARSQVPPGPRDRTDTRVLADWRQLQPVRDDHPGRRRLPVRLLRGAVVLQRPGAGDSVVAARTGGGYLNLEGIELTCARTPSLAEVYPSLKPSLTRSLNHSGGRRVETDERV